MRLTARLFSAGIAAATALALGSCDVDLGERPVAAAHTLGEITYQQACQRVAYSTELGEYQRGQRPALDASGVRYRPLCHQGEPAPADAPVVMQAVAAERASIVRSVDTAVPVALEDPLDRALRGMLPALDGGEAQAAASAGGAVAQGMAADPEVPLALARLGQRDGYRPLMTDGALARAVLDYADIWAVGNTVLPLLWPSTPGGSDAAGSDGRKALLRAVSRELALMTKVPDVGQKDRTARLTSDFLLSESAELRTLPTGQSLWAVRRDVRGVALVNAPVGALPPGFIDRDRDGLADLDGLGRFVGADGRPLPEVTPFPTWSQRQPGGKDQAAARDASGRALLAAGGQPLFSYVNLDDTVLAGLLRESAGLFDPKRDIPLRLARGALPLLGPRVPARKDYPTGSIEYTGFDKAQAPLLDMGYALTQLVSYSDAGDTTGADLLRLLRGLQLLLLNSEPVVAQSLDAMIKGFDTAKRADYDAARLGEQSTLYDDLLPVLVRLVRVPGLLNEVLASLSDPAVRDLGPIISILLSDSSYVFMNQGQLDASKPGATIGVLGKPINRMMADSDVDKNPGSAQNNRSLVQRVLQIVHDANGIPLCNRDGAYVNLTILFIDIKIAGPAKPCELYRLDDLALYFLLSIADKSERQRDPYNNFLNALLNGVLKAGAQALNLVGGLGDLIGVPGFTDYPGPEQLARILFIDDSRRSDFFRTTLDLGACSPKRPGTLCSNRNLPWRQDYDGALFALEAVRAPSGSGNNFYKAFRPVVNAFARYDECVARDGNGACTKKRNAAKILVDLLSVLHRHWPTENSRFYGQDYEAQSKKSGLSRYEPLIADLLTKGGLWSSTLQLGPTLANTRLDDGSNLPVATVVSRFLVWLLDPEAPRLGGALAFRDGGTMAQRNDGRPTFQRMNDPFLFEAIAPAAAGRVTPFDLFAAAWKKKRAVLAMDPQKQAEWSGAVSAAADLYLSALPVAASYKLGTPRLRALLVSTLELLRGRVRGHAQAGDLKAWAQRGLYSDLEAALTGPIAAGAVDTFSAVAGDAEASAQLYRLLASILGDPGPQAADAARFQAVLYAAADLVQLLLDDADLVPILKGLGPLFDPDSGAVDGLLAVLRRGLPTDRDQVLVTLGRNFLRSDPTGRYPASYLSDSIAEISRARAGAPGVRGTDFDEADYREVLSSLGQTLLDEKRGVRRILDVIAARRSGE